MKILFVYPRFERHADAHPELREHVPMDEYLGSPSLGMAALAALVPEDWEVEFRDDRVADADTPTDADLVALSFFTPAARRALLLADRFRDMGHTVVAGGLFTTALPDVVQPHVDTVVVGEGEGIWLQVLEDARTGTLRPRYEAPAPADLSSLPVPALDLYFGAEGPNFAPDDYPLQLSRGCPLTCHACVLPLSMGAHLRPFPLEHAIAQLEQLRQAGKRACLTEDTSWFPGPSRRLLEGLLDYVIASGEPAPISYIGISMPMIRATPRALLDKARAAGIDMFYLVGGFDPITQRAFTGEDPKAYQRALDAISKSWDAGIEPYTSFLLGGDADDPGTADRMLEFAAEAGIRKAEFAIATPYPGTPQWRRLVAEDRILTRDWSRYNDANVVFRPARMTPEELLEGYLHLWRGFYADKQHYATDLDPAARTIQF